MTFYHIDFEPIGRRGQCPADQSLLDCARELGVDIVLEPPGLDTLLDQLAQILWRHRHLIPESENKND